ncbi:MAG: thioredoxin family protein [Flavobacterium sp.]
MKKIMVYMFLFLGTLGYSQNWKTNFDEAKKEATEQNKKILLVFSGSDWCAPCIKLDKNVWQSEEFKVHANDNYVLLRADFPKKKANTLPADIKNRNLLLADKYNKEGFFPLVVLLDNTGKVLGKKGYENISASEYITQLKSFIK